MTTELAQNTMINRRVYARDPLAHRLLNNGVASVNDAATLEERQTLRFELETFVCDGKYKDGLEAILRNFIDGLGRGEQRGVWVSGFFGSGKSHLVKMLRALWVNFKFPENGTTARGLVKLPVNIQDLLVELDNAARRHGGLHAASGTLGQGAGDYVRMAILAIVFGSVGLSKQYNVAQLELWLKREGIFDQVKRAVETAGRTWEDERRHLFVSTIIGPAILNEKPDLASSLADLGELFRQQFPNVQDITTEQLIDAITDALTPPGGTFPLTLIALDEIQQYIGENRDRTYAIQEVTETLSKRFKGRLLFVGTGQTSLSGTPNLKKLMGRFQLSIELSDNDVDAVIRKVILAKKPDAIDAVTKTMDANLGEISRHLSGTKLEHRAEDIAYLAPDYPILPVRRRFWERTLRAVDQGGNQSQLRNQLKIVHEAIVHSAGEPLGTVVPGDFIFGQISANLLQSGVLGRDIYDYIAGLSAGSDKEQLQARACSLIYLINKLPREAAMDLGVRATPDMLADLLVEDLSAGSADLRKQMPAVLEALEKDGKIMAIDAEYRLQTPESSAWHGEFTSQKEHLSNHTQTIEQARIKILRQACEARVKNLRLVQGVCKESRATSIHFGGELPQDLGSAVHFWFRDGWAEDERNVLADARQAPNNSPVVYIYLPKRAGDELNRALADRLAARATLEKRGAPNTEAGHEARRAMETTALNAEKRLNALVDDAFAFARIFQAGGQELGGATLIESLQAAAENALVRVFPRFDEADHAGWPKVIELARKDSQEALGSVGFKGDADKHPVTSALLKFVANGKKGADIRDHFSQPEYGWPRDAIDGGLWALLATGHLRATDSAGNPLSAKGLERSKITQASFRTESTTISTVQRLKVRQLINDLVPNIASGEELASAPRYLHELRTLAQRAGGEAPRPATPDTSILDELAGYSGNDQLLALHERHEQLDGLAKTWRETAETIEKRIKNWQMLQDLFAQVSAPVDASDIKIQVDAILHNRLLLAQPDPVPALVDQLTQRLREALVAAHDRYQQAFDAGNQRLAEDANWAKLSPEARHELRSKHHATIVPDIKTGTTPEVLTSLRSNSLTAWADRTAALPARFDQIATAAAEAVLPDPVFMKLPGATITTQADLDAWLNELRTQLEAKLKDADGSPLVVS